MRMTGCSINSRLQESAREILTFTTLLFGLDIRVFDHFAIACQIASQLF